MIRIVSWNVAGRDLWRDLLDHDADVGLLQEARQPDPAWRREVTPADLTTWTTAGWAKREWRTAVAMPTGDHRLIVAGDWNILFRYGERGDSYWRDRYALALPT